MSDALRSWKDVFVFPIGLNITEFTNEKITEVNVVAIYGSTIKTFPIVRVETEESIFGSSYNYMSCSMSTTKKISYKLQQSSQHQLLSTRNKEISFHYKWDAGMKAVDAYELFSSIIVAMKGNFETVLTENGAWRKIRTYNGSMINFLVDKGAKKQKEMTFLLETLESHVSIHPDNLEESQLLMIENLRTYKIWGEQ